MKFTKYNNPNKKRTHKKSPHSSQYIEERKKEMYELLAKAETDEQKDAIIKAFNVTIRPF